VIKRLVIASEFPAARKAEEAVLGEVARQGYDKSSIFAIKLAMEEGLNNAIRHGNGMNPAKKVQLSYDIRGDRVVIGIADQGVGFDPLNVPDPTADENLEKPSGRGIMLMRAYMDEVRFSKDGRHVRMVKRKGQDES
jgi:serine/threonine-protein kinase RsbW